MLDKGYIDHFSPNKTGGMSKVSNLTSGLPAYSLEGFETDLLSDSCQDIIVVIEERSPPEVSNSIPRSRILSLSK